MVCPGGGGVSRSATFLLISSCRTDGEPGPSALRVQDKASGKHICAGVSELSEPALSHENLRASWPTLSLSVLFFQGTPALCGHLQCGLR